ncbi:MAG: choice-of-anchor D domain-containing protein [Candidatus Kapabacteria bacterium]|nr:choice-of-anchor D domain-containing protein [Candidatus Kapabacteria bacterium]
MDVASLWRRRLTFLLFVFSTFTVGAWSQISLTLTSVNGSWPTEVGWQVVNTSTNIAYNCELPGGTLQNNVIFSVPAGTYEVRAWDSYGDAWNGASVTIKYTVSGTALVTNATYTLFFSSVNTCPGPTAVTNTAQVISSFTVVTPCFAPTITTQPLSQTRCQGTPATFSVASSMTSGVYEWRKNGVILVTNTSTTYTIAAVTPSDAGLYDVIARDNCNPTVAFTSSASAQLTVSAAPAITVQPQASRIVCESANDTLRIRAVGVNRTFQWRFNGVDIAGARDSNYVITNMGATQAGVYDCIVSGLCPPSVTSSTSTVVAAIRPRITTQPLDLDICPGASGSLSVSASGANLVYQWFKDGVAVPNGFNQTLAFTNFDYASNGQYYCLVRSDLPNPNNCQLTVSSRNVRVSGFRTPIITSAPRSLDVCIGTQMSLVVEAGGSGLAYQWFKNGVAIPNAVANELAIKSVVAANSGDYTVRVTGTCGLSVTSSAAKVVVISKPTLTLQPSSKVITVGDRLELNVSATDSRSIQWMKNDQPIPGATTPMYVIERASKGDAGYYNAIVRNSCSGVSSAYARIDVNDVAVPTPILELSQTSVEFGEIPSGYDKSLALNGLIKNVGTAPLIISGISTSSSQFAITNAPSLPLTLAPGEVAGVSLKSSPTSLGALTGTLTVLSNSPANTTATVSLAASYVLRYRHETAEDFGKVSTESSIDRCVSLTNTSAMSITIEQVNLTGTNSAQFSTVTGLPLTIAAGQSADLCVKFTPGSAGAKTATLNLRSSVGGNSLISLTGVGEIPAGVVDAEEAGIAAWPNPMSDEFEIRFDKSTPKVNISVISLTGNQVAAYSHPGVDAGGSIRWNGRDATGASVASGSYRMILRYGDTIVTIPVSIIR